MDSGDEGLGARVAACRARECFTWNTPRWSAPEGCRWNPSPSHAPSWGAPVSHETRSLSRSVDSCGITVAAACVLSTGGDHPSVRTMHRYVGRPHGVARHRVESVGLASKHRSTPLRYEVRTGITHWPSSDFLLPCTSGSPTRAACESNVAAPIVFHVKHECVCRRKRGRGPR